MASPNVEGSSNPTSTGGNVFGVQVGASTTENVGFFGSAGTTQGSAATNGDTLAHLVTYLQALGLLGS